MLISLGGNDMKEHVFWELLFKGRELLPPMNQSNPFLGTALVLAVLCYAFWLAGKLVLYICRTRWQLESRWDAVGNYFGRAVFIIYFILMSGYLATSDSWKSATIPNAQSERLPRTWESALTSDNLNGTMPAEQPSPQPTAPTSRPAAAGTRRDH